MIHTGRTGEIPNTQISKSGREENWVEGRGGLGSPFSNPPPWAPESAVCFLTMPGGGGGGLLLSRWGGGGLGGCPNMHTSK